MDVDNVAEDSNDVIIKPSDNDNFDKIVEWANQKFSFEYITKKGGNYSQLRAQKRRKSARWNYTFRKMLQNALGSSLEHNLSRGEHM